MTGDSPHTAPGSGTFDEKETLQRMAAGDEKAFERLVTQYGSGIYSHALAYTKSVEKAEELTQDIFLRIWSLRRRLTEVESFENYLFILARNMIFRSFRKKVQEMVSLTEHMEGAQQVFDALTPDLTTEARAAYQLLLKGIEELPEKRRRVFRMSRIEGMTHKQIAATLGIHEITVAQYIVKSLSFLKEYLRKHGTDMVVLAVVCGVVAGDA